MRVYVPVSHKDPSVSVSPALGLHVGATLSHISVGAGEQTQVSTPVLQVD